MKSMQISRLHIEASDRHECSFVGLQKGLVWCDEEQYKFPECFGNMAMETSFSRQFAACLSERLGVHADRLTADEPRLRMFVEQLTQFMREAGADLKAVPLSKTLVNWCRDGSVPYWNRFEPVFDFMFHDKPNDVARARLRDAWAGADAERSAGLGRSRRAVAANLEGPEPGISDFDVEGDEPLQPGLVELRIDPPPRGANTPNLVPIQVMLAFAECEDMVEGVGVTLALTDAALLPTYQPGCAPERNTRAGEAENGCNGLTLRAGQWAVSGPRNDAGHLDGEPLAANQTLLTLRVPGQETDGMSLTLRSKPKALVVIPDDPDDEARITKDKLLQLLLQRTQDPDNDGWITWGRARLRRKKPA